MSDILFVTWDGGGNVPPMLAMARELRGRGHRVRLLGHASQREALTASGFHVERTEHARPFSALDSPSTLALLAAFTDRGLGRDLLDAVARKPADLVVVDCLMFGALDAARRAGLRYAILHHYYGSIYERDLRGPFSLVHRLRGLRPRLATDRSALRVVVTLPELDQVTPDCRQVGPVVEWSPRVPDRGPMVLVSLSTFGFPGMAAALQRVIDAAAGLDARVVVTTGPAVDPDDLVVPDGVEVHRFVPHHELMREATLFVGHGGHGSAMAALAHDVPMVLMPMDAMSDQPAVAKSVEAAGAGRMVRKKATVDQLRPVIAELLADGPHRAAAARLGAAVRARPGAPLGADALEEALAASLTR